MSAPEFATREELLAAEALAETLAEGEGMQLDLRDDSLMRAAAALELAWAVDGLAGAMPASVRSRVSDRLRAIASRDEADAPALRVVGEQAAHAAGLKAGVPEDDEPRLMFGRGMAALGWIAAAAAVALAFVGWLRTPGAVTPTPTPPVAAEPTLAEQWSGFERAHADAKRASWGDWALNEQGPEVAGVRGEVVWSESAQTGLMRFVGLPENDPRELQYQLWIVDRRGLFDPSGQSARISGGVFDASGAERLADGSIVVPIAPALSVQGAGAFAVTIEQPGGVWASDMSRRVVIAALGA